MQNQSFDASARILHKGQYEIRKRAVEVPIKQFNNTVEQIEDVQTRIDAMNQEIAELEEILKEKRKLSRSQANKIIDQAHDQAKKVLEDAEQHAFDRVQKSVHEKEMLLLRTSEEVERIKAEAQRDADNIQYEAKKASERLKEQSKEDGYQAGFDKGLDDGKSEVSFAVERLHSIIAETARERERILVHSENQVINLVLTMVSKVVKKLSAEHQDVVIENTKAALELLRGAMTLFVRVSPHDFNYTSSFKEELIRMIEAKAELKFIEDPTIEPGGVYIETDMGDVDATIRSQLDELSTQMHFYMPIKVHAPKPPQEVKSADITAEKKDVPKTEFAQREEYISTIESATSETPKSDNVVDNIVDDVTINDTGVVDEVATNDTSVVDEVQADNSVDKVADNVVESPIADEVAENDEVIVVEDSIAETPTDSEDKLDDDIVV